MTANQLKSNALLVIGALIAGTVISATAHFLLTSRDTGGETPSESAAAEVAATSPTDSLTEQDKPETGGMHSDDDSTSQKDAAVDSPVDSTDSDEPKIETYEQKMESLYAKLDELKSTRQAIRDRIQFDSPEL